MMKEFLFQIANAPSGLTCKSCQMPAEFLAGYHGLEIEALCSTCIAPFTLQILKLRGVNLGLIEAAFLKLSAAVDLPPGSILLQ